jgi:hypothetical protein
MERSEERAARNEARFRDANERIDQRRHELGVEAQTPYICECAREECTEIVRMPPSEYLAVRTDPTRFLQVPGHADGSERLVAERDGYVVVEKTGASARTAREEA